MSDEPITEEDARKMEEWAGEKYLDLLDILYDPNVRSISNRRIPGSLFPWEE